MPSDLTPDARVRVEAAVDAYREAVEAYADEVHGGTEYERDLSEKAKAALLATVAAVAREAVGAGLRVWAEEVVRIWHEAWEPKPSHRYGHDFPAFLGERLLTDYDLRDIEPRTASTPPTPSAPRP